MKNASWKAALAACSLLLVGVMSGCGPQMTDEELFDRARDVSFTAKAAVADVQLQILDGNWRVQEYGDAPATCGSDGYQFTIQRATPLERDWRLAGTPAEETARVGAWMEANGWTDIAHQTYSEGITNVVLKASKPDAYIRELTVDFVTGEGSDGATIRATTTCQPGSESTLRDLQDPEGPDGSFEIVEKLPATEHPTAKQSFGYTEEGRPRFYDQ